MSSERDEQLLSMGEALPALDMNDLRAERIRRAAHAAMAEGPRRSIGRRLSRRIEPLLALGVAAASLYWVLQPIVMHYR